tara:strand:+ start:31679 stop:34033 length:2355 start_codon:yes stop_codon:yes gene_type:complete
MSQLSLPKFKQPSKSKTKEWANEILTYAGNTLSLYTTNNIRTDVRDKIINLDLYNSIIHVEDFVKLVNPLDLATIDASREIQHYPIAAPLVDLQVGEMINRPFDPIVMITNNIAIEEKMQRRQAWAREEMARVEKEFEGDEAALKSEMEALQRKLKYTYKDIVEKKASALIDHYWNELGMKETSVEAFRRMFFTGEELYEIDIVNNEPTFRVVNTVKLRTYGGGNSNKIHESDIIVVEDHFSAGYLIDRYGDELTEEEVDRILSFETGMGTYDKPYGDVGHEFVDGEAGEILGNELSSNYVDSNSNVRHLRVRWKAYKMIKKILYQDPSTGEEQVKIVGDTYRMKQGEALKEKVWIYDWWIGTLIGADIKVDCKPIPIRYNRLGSLSEGHPGLVGRAFNLNERTAVPPMTRMRPYQYLYDVIVDNMVVAMSKNIGPILEMDMAKRPNGWTTGKWLNYMTKYNVKFVDNFKEITQGPATGTLAGNMQAGRDQVSQLDFGNYIQQLVNMAEYLKSAMAEIVGITPQRMGAVSNRESVGGVEVAKSQSSHMTEWLFYIHDENLVEALNIFVEGAKFALKDNPKKLQNIVDGFTREMIDVSEDDFAGADLGVFISNSQDAKKHKQILEQVAHAYMQNGGDFSFVFDILFSNSMSEKRKLIEDHEDKLRKEQSQAREQEMAAVTSAQEMAAQAEETKLQIDKSKVEMDKYKADLDSTTKIRLKEMDLLSAQGKLNVDENQSKEQLAMSMQTLQQDMGKEATRAKEKQQELSIKDKEVEAKKAAPTTSSS